MLSNTLNKQINVFSKGVDDALRTEFGEKADRPKRTQREN